MASGEVGQLQSGAGVMSLAIAVVVVRDVAAPLHAPECPAEAMRRGRDICRRAPSPQIRSVKLTRPRTTDLTGPTPLLPLPNTPSLVRVADPRIQEGRQAVGRRRAHRAAAGAGQGNTLAAVRAAHAVTAAPSQGPVYHAVCGRCWVVAVRRAAVHYVKCVSLIMSMGS